MERPVSSETILRSPANPVVKPSMAPYPSVLAYNAGVTKYEGRYVMVFRNDYGFTRETLYSGGTNLGFATSRNGVDWEVAPKPCFAMGSPGGEIQRAYDPRLTVIGGRVYMCFALDTKHGIRGGIAVTEDFEKFDVVSLTTPDNRNLVLFPDRIGGKFLRLERPFTVYGRAGKDRFDLWMSGSPDLKYWGDPALVLGVEDVPFANDKIGPAAPPVRTSKGFLTLFHAVDRDESRGKNGWEPKWTKRYTAGVMLLDLEDPSKVIGLSREPLLAPEAPYETDGYRNDVVFPGGMILEESGEVKIYYGAADTVECLATADVGELLGLCVSPR